MVDLVDGWLMNILFFSFFRLIWLMRKEWTLNVMTQLGITLWFFWDVIWFGTHHLQHYKGPFGAEYHKKVKFSFCYFIGQYIYGQLCGGQSVISYFVTLSFIKYIIMGYILVYSPMGLFGKIRNKKSLKKSLSFLLLIIIILQRIEIPTCTIWFNMAPG